MDYIILEYEDVSLSYDSRTIFLRGTGDAYHFHPRVDMDSLYCEKIMNIHHGYAIKLRLENDLVVDVTILQTPVELITDEYKSSQHPTRVCNKQ